MRLQRQGGLEAGGAGVGWADVVHAQFSDSLYAGTAADAASAFCAWAAGVRAPLVVTLHDVPGHDPDPARDARRAPAYRRVAAMADAVVVSAPHELSAAAPGAVLVPLPREVLPAPGPRPAWADRPTIGVLGFVFPGKGHGEVLRAAAGARVVALGTASPGHEGLVVELRREADALDVELVVTGPLSEPDLHAGALAVTVPVAAYRTLGASGSLQTWAACGRRPVVTPSPLTLALDPGTVVMAHDLTGAVEHALLHPGSTWLDAPAPPVDVAAALREVYARVVR